MAWPQRQRASLGVRGRPLCPPRPPSAPLGPPRPPSAPLGPSAGPLWRRRGCRQRRLHDCCAQLGGARGGGGWGGAHPGHGGRHSLSVPPAGSSPRCQLPAAAAGDRAAAGISALPAQRACQQGEQPVGCAGVVHGQVLRRAEGRRPAVAHARRAAKEGGARGCKGRRRAGLQRKAARGAAKESGARGCKGRRPAGRLQPRGRARGPPSFAGQASSNPCSPCCCAASCKAGAQPSWSSGQGPPPPPPATALPTERSALPLWQRRTPAAACPPRSSCRCAGAPQSPAAAASPGSPGAAAPGRRPTTTSAAAT
jgi:hypothetical protein